MLLLTLAAQFLEEPARASRLLPGVKMKAKKSFVTCETACKYDNTLQVQMASCRERERCWKSPGFLDFFCMTTLQLSH